MFGSLKSGASEPGGSSTGAGGGFWDFANISSDDGLEDELSNPMFVCDILGLVPAVE
jgi:hypothetical protein